MVAPLKYATLSRIDVFWALSIQCVHEDGNGSMKKQGWSLLVLISSRAISFYTHWFFAELVRIPWLSSNPDLWISSGLSRNVESRYFGVPGFFIRILHPILWVAEVSVAFALKQSSCLMSLDLHCLKRLGLLRRVDPFDQMRPNLLCQLLFIL
jgi:hypothetical protein